MGVGRSEYDVVIVGAGPGGGTIAWRLASHGVRVLLLDGGPEYDPFTDYDLHSERWETGAFPSSTRLRGKYSFGPMQPLEKKFEHLRSWNHISGQLNRTENRLPGMYFHVRGIGGSTLHFNGEAHRLNPEGMNMGTRFGRAADWPVNYAELEPYYAIAEEILGVAGSREQTSRWRSGPFPLPAHARGYASKKMISGTRRMGVNWEHNPLAILSRPFDGRPGCNYCGNCVRGCPRTDKGSVDVTFIRRAIESGKCTVIPESPVTRVNAGTDDRVESVEYLGTDGNTHKVSTRLLVVACGAIESPRLLLLSENRHAPDGLANDSGQVGRNFMETLLWYTSGVYPQPLGSTRGLPQDIICWDYNTPGSIPGVIGGCRFYPGMAEQGFLGPIGYAKNVVAGWGTAHKQAMRELYGRVMTIGSIGECLPNAGSYIDLDPTTIDDHGYPVARINSFLDDQRTGILSFMAEKSREMLASMNVTGIFQERGTYDYFNSTHVFGTCRMGNDPEDSVVNNQCQSHRWKNLFVVDASVFPSSGGGEAPSLTIEALAIRAADGIRARMVAREI